MRIVKTDAIHPGTLLGRTIYRDDGLPLLTAGTLLSARLLQRLIEEDVLMVYIEDPVSKGIVPTSPVTEQMLMQGTRTMRTIFDAISANKDFRSKEDGSLTYVYSSEHMQALSDLIDDLLLELSKCSDTLYQILHISTVDQYTYRHSVDVAVLAMLIGRELGLDEKSIKHLGMGGILHDIGKAHIDLNILKKPGALDDSEWEEMKRHPLYGYNALRDVLMIHGHVKQMVLYHHERLDGSGYPHGIKGDQLSLFTRIIAVSDIFNALGSNRHYRQAMHPDKILDLLYSESVYKLDRNVVSSLLKVVHVYPEGTSVRLTDGRIGIVVESRRLAPTRPLIRLIDNQEHIDLMYELTLFVDDVIH